MKALLSKEVGGPDTLVLEDVPSPQAKSGFAVVEVKAVGVNFPDVLIIEDKYQFKPSRPFAPGGEISGVVKSVGEGVTHVKPGDRVLGNTGWGGMAEELALEASRLVKIPDAMPFDDAAAFIMTYGTSWHALKDRADLQPGQSLLVLGAAGGVGMAAVELGKALGAHVIGAVSTAEKAAAVRAVGADEVLVYPRAPFDRDQSRALADAFKSAIGGDGANIVYDVIGGDYSEPALRAIAWEGRYLVVGFPAGIAKLPLNLILLKSCDVCGVFLGAFVTREPAAHRRNMAELFSLWEADKIKPLVTATYPFARGGEAIAALGARQAIGKLVVTID